MKSLKFAFALFCVIGGAMAVDTRPAEANSPTGNCGQYSGASSCESYCAAANAGNRTGLDLGYQTCVQRCSACPGH